MQVQGDTIAFLFLGVNQLSRQVAQSPFRFLESPASVSPSPGVPFLGFHGEGNVIGQGFQQADLLIGKEPRLSRHTWLTIHTTRLSTRSGKAPEDR